MVQALGENINVVVRHTCEDAKAALDDNIGLIVCGVHFDSGQMFEFLRFAKQHPKGKSVPFVVVLGETGRYSPAIIQGIERAVKVRGADVFFDIAKKIQDSGKEEAFKQIQQKILQRLSE